MTEQNRHLFGFLGTGRYDRDTKTYAYDPCAYAAPWADDFTSPVVTFVQTASALSLVREVGSDAATLQTTIFATEKARELHRESLAREFATQGLTAPTFIEIPSHFDEASIIALFEALSDNLMTDNAVLSFDMTHGFRAQPAIALLVLDYIQAVNPTCRVEHLLYGAYQKDLEAVPLVDLIGLWQLRDWAAGFREFHRTGSVARIGELVQDQRNNFMRATRGKEGSPNALTGFEKQIHRFEQLANMNAIPALFGDGDTSGSIELLVESANQPWEGLSRQLGRFVDPLRQELGSRFSPMISRDWSSRQGLLAQIEWIEWLERHGRYQQALTVAREWATTFAALVLEEAGHKAIQRKEANELLNLTRTDPAHRWNRTAAQDQLILILESRLKDDFLTMCGQLELRNRVNHAWMPSPNAGSEASPDKQNPSRVLQKAAAAFREALE